MEKLILMNQRALLWMELRRLNGRIDFAASQDRTTLQERVIHTDQVLAEMAKDGAR